MFCRVWPVAPLPGASPDVTYSGPICPPPLTHTSLYLPPPPYILPGWCPQTQPPSLRRLQTIELSTGRVGEVSPPDLITTCPSWPAASSKCHPVVTASHCQTTARGTQSGIKSFVFIRKKKVKQQEKQGLATVNFSSKMTKNVERFKFSYRAVTVSG